MPKVAHHTTKDRRPITILLREASDQDPETTPKAKSILLPTPARKDIIPPPGFDPTYSPFHNPLEPVQEPVKEAVKQPVAAAPNFDHPFIHTPYINRTVYSLLDIMDEYDAENSDLPYYLYFPPNFGIYNPEIKSDWSTRAHYMGAPWPGSPNPYLTANGGLTKADKAFIRDALRFQELPMIWR